MKFSRFSVLLKCLSFHRGDVYYHDAYVHGCHHLHGFRAAHGFRGARDFRGVHDFRDARRFYQAVCNFFLGTLYPFHSENKSCIEINEPVVK